jgi:pullulanase
MLSQGIPFIHSGQEFGRSKAGHDNSYALGDGFNNIQWDEKLDQHAMFEFFRSAVRLRRDHPCLRLPDRDTITQSVERLHALEADLPSLLAVMIQDHAGHDRWERILILLNGGRSKVQAPLPEGDWCVAVNSCEFDATPYHMEPPVLTGDCTIEPGTGTVLFKPRTAES